MVVSTGLCTALHIAYILLLAQELKLAIFCSKQCAQHWHWPPPARARVNFSVQCVQGFNLTYIITVCGTQDKYWATSCKNVHLLRYKWSWRGFVSGKWTCHHIHLYFLQINSARLLYYTALLRDLGRGHKCLSWLCFAARGCTFNALLGAPVALMEQLQAIVLPENAHNTTKSGFF